jgi:hypothetical protein
MMVGMTMLVACSDDKGKATALNVVVTEDGGQVKIDVPPSIKGGVVNLSLKNSGQGPHSLQFAKVAGDHTPDELVGELTNSEQGAPVPDWISEGGGIGTVGPGQTGTASFKLTEGRHFAYDDESDEQDAPNSTKGGVVEIDVTAGSGGSLPEADATITATEYKFTTKGLKAGATKVRFENEGKEYHHVIAGPMVPGKTIDDVRAFFETEGEPVGPPPINFEAGVGTAVIDRGNAEVATLNLQAGKYAMVCFVNDRAGGPPHFTMGMLQEATVT